LIIQLMEANRLRLSARKGFMFAVSLNMAQAFF
jgi:hypothetical protein